MSNLSPDTLITCLGLFVNARVAPSLPDGSTNTQAEAQAKSLVSAHQELLNALSELQQQQNQQQSTPAPSGVFSDNNVVEVIGG